MLSTATKGSDLCKLLRVAVYLNRQDIAHKTIHFLNPQRLSELSNNELASIHGSIVLTKFKDQEYTPLKDLN